jgi:hypothetical protein
MPYRKKVGNNQTSTMGRYAHCKTQLIVLHEDEILQMTWSPEHHAPLLLPWIPGNNGFRSTCYQSLHEWGVAVLMRVKHSSSVRSER